MIPGASSHIFIYEQGGSAYIGGVASKPLANESDGTIKYECHINIQMNIVNNYNIELRVF
jgi:threonine aldolase